MFLQLEKDRLIFSDRLIFFLEIWLSVLAL